MAEDTPPASPVPESIRGAAYWLRMGAFAVVTLTGALAATTAWTLSETRSEAAAMERRHDADISRVESQAKEDRAEVRNGFNKLDGKLDRVGEHLIGRQWSDDRGQ